MTLTCLYPPPDVKAIWNVIRAVSEMTGISVLLIKSQVRMPRIVAARHLAMYCARVLTEASLPVIGREFGGRHHTSVLYAVRQVGKKKVEKKVERVRKAVKG